MDALTEVGDEDDRRRYADEKEAVRLAGEIAADDGANDEAHAWEGVESTEDVRVLVLRRHIGEVCLGQLLAVLE